MESQLFFSLIVPVYNVEKYLKECVDSILIQDFTDFEVILINDGSLDSSGEICNGYAEKDNRVKVINQKNGGLSVARNTGISQAKGKYIWFIDSDDWISKDALKVLFYHLKNEKLEVISFSYRSFNEVTKIYSEPLYIQSILTTTGRDFYQLKNDFFPSACMHIYKNSFIQENSLLFKKDLFHEDDYFNLSCFSKIKTIKKITESLYFYRLRPNSIITNTSYTVLVRRVESLFEILTLCSTISDLDVEFLELRRASYKKQIYAIFLKASKSEDITFGKLYKLTKSVKKHIGTQSLNTEGMSRKESIMEHISIYSFNNSSFLFSTFSRAFFYYYKFKS